MSFRLNEQDKQLIELALSEDLGLPYQDITSNNLFTDDTTSTKVKIISKHNEPMVLCGLPVAQHILSVLNDNCRLETEYADGDVILPGQSLLTIIGPSKTILMAERTLLNFLQRLCAIATLTAKFVNRIQHTSTKILDTRKTMPGFRHLDKYAVQCGGGFNHRMGLYDAFMIKDTHVDALGGMENALRKLPEKNDHEYPVVVEVRSPEELKIVMDKGLSKISRVLLDNMTPELTRECVRICNNKIPIESSGNINLENIADIAECGVDFISIGKITHSAGNIDLSMKAQHAECHFPAR